MFLPRTTDADIFCGRGLPQELTDQLGPTFLSFASGRFHCNEEGLSWRTPDLSRDKEGYGISDVQLLLT